MRVYRERSHKWWHTLLKVLLIAVLMLGVSFSLAYVWQTTEQTVAAEQLAQPPTDMETDEEPEPEAPEEPEPQPPEPEEPDEPEAERTSATHVVFEGAVPESDPVDNDYFDDAIFFGDSITTGIPLYHIADNAAVVAMTGINTHSINTEPVIRVDDDSDERITVLEKATQYGERGKVYIMLGGNSIGYDIATFISGYETFLTSVKEMYPGAVIYLQSMTPVVDGYVNEFDPELDNDKINTYNLEILALAQRHGVYYLDVASALKDENGALPLEASPVDGMHFTPEYYTKWFEYLKRHTVGGTAQ